MNKDDLNAQPDASSGDFGVEDYLLKMLELKASDVFLRPGSPAAFRIGGRIVRSDLPHPVQEHLKRFLDQHLPESAHKRFQASPDLDIAHTIPGKGRFRINLFRHQGQLGLVARLIPLGAVEFDSLSLPPVIRDMADRPSGLILVVGPTGCGKSTTLASLVHHINSTRATHIVTIEDPIEFVHEERKALIHQRQVGFDTESFSTALRHVVRQSPDAILIGEMRDQDTIQTALSAAMTGHLIMSTLHTTNVVQSIDRMLNYFPPDARKQAQIDLAATLIGMVSMRLLPRCDGSGRIPAVEVLVATPTVRRLIAEGNLTEIYDVMKRGEDVGMLTLNKSLVNLTKDEKIEQSVALRYAPNPDEFRLNMEGMYTGIDSIDLRTNAQKKKDDEA